MEQDTSNQDGQGHGAGHGVGGPSAPPFMIFHGTDDSTVPFSQSAELHDLLEKNGCDVTLVAINGAEHADIFFAQEKLWDMVAKFFKDKLYQ